MKNDNPQDEARRAVAELAANGATFTYRPASNALPPSFVYELTGDGNRQQCRRIIAAAKSQPLVWSALLREIADRTGARP